MVTSLAAIAMAALLFPALALGQDADKPAIQLQKGNFWKYEIKKGEKVFLVKAEVAEYRKRAKNEKP